MIECITLHGDKKLVEAGDLMFRPAAYGIVIHDDHVLVVNTKSTGKWFMPGGEIEKGERAEDALKREIKEEAGIEIEIEKFLTFHESFFYYDPLNKAYQNLSFIFICKPLTFKLTDAANENGDEANKPQWVPINDLKPTDWQAWAGEVFEKYIQQ